MPKGWKDYPETYFTVVEKFAREGEDVVLEDTYAAASYTRHDLHRFFTALSLAAESDPLAAKLSNITRDILLIIEPPHTKRESPAKLIIRLNPLTKAMIQHKPGV